MFICYTRWFIYRKKQINYISCLNMHSFGRIWHVYPYFLIKYVKWQIIYIEIEIFSEAYRLDMNWHWTEFSADKMLLWGQVSLYWHQVHKPRICHCLNKVTPHIVEYRTDTSTHIVELNDVNRWINVVHVFFCFFSYYW